MTTRTREPRAPSLMHGALALLVGCLLALALAGPSNIHEKEQPGTTAFMADVADNGAWLVQRLPDGEVATKPPLLHWAGGLSLEIFGPGELSLKLPGLLCFLATCLVVYALAREELGPRGACVAVACFASVNPALKLAHVARPDMPVTLWLTLALLATLRQRTAWREGNAAPIRWIAAFWSAVALAMLTKGQLALIPVLWLVLLVTVSRFASGVPLRRTRPLLQVAGLLFALAVFGAWFAAAWRAEPGFAAMLEQEVVRRTSASEEFLQGRTREPWNVPLYVLSRFAPWSILLVLTGVMLLVSRAERRRAAGAAPDAPSPSNPPPPVAWAFSYIGVVCAALMTQPTHRPDHLLPAYPAAAVIAGAAVVHAARFTGPHRTIVAIVIAAIALSAVASPLLVALLPEPTLLAVAAEAGAPAPALAHRLNGSPPGTTIEIASACVLAIAGGLGALVLLRFRRLDAGALGAALAFAGLLGLNKMLLSEEARSRIGDSQAATARLAAAAAAELDAPIDFYRTGYTSVQPLLGRNDPEDSSRLANLVASGRGAVLVTRAEERDAVTRAGAGRVRLLYRVEPEGDAPPEGRFLIFHIEPAASGG